MTLRTATGLIAAYMRLFGFYGWASFWHVIYVLPGHENNRKDVPHPSYQRLLRHWEGRFHLPSFERKHLEQIETLGS